MNEKRLKEITEAALDAYGQPLSEAFVEGAKWADEHPLSKYNLSNADYIKVTLEDIVRNAERLTTGNVAHNGNNIKLMAIMALKHFEKNDI